MEAAEVDIKIDAKGKPVTPDYKSLVSDEYGRFKYGIPPRSYGDLAFLQHMLSVLKQNGKMGIVLPHGVLFRGSSEGKIREALLQNDFIEAIIGLPEKLFYNTGIPASIIIINKSKPQELKNKVIIIRRFKRVQRGEKSKYSKS